MARSELRRSRPTRVPARARAQPPGRIELLPAILTFAVVSVVGYSGGGFFPRTWRLSLLALLAISAAALVARERITVSRREWCVVIALGALTAWTALSYYWSSLPSDSLVESERMLLYTVAVLTVVLGATRASLPSLLIGAVAGVTAVSGYALGRYIFAAPQAPDKFQGWHLFEPFGYANAIAIYVTLGVLLTVGLVLWARSSAGRMAAAAPLLVLVPTLYYASSRGAWVALPIGLAAMLFVNRRLRSVSILLALLGAMLLADLALIPESGQGLSVFGEYRPTYWGIALDDVELNPLLGSGAGTFGRFLLDHSATPYYAHDAHSLYLETLAELGPLALALLLAGLGLPLVATRTRQGAIVAAALGTYVAFLLHAGVDWDLEFTAVGLLGCLVAGVTLVGTRADDVAALSLRARGALLVVIAGLAAIVAARLALGG